MKFLLCLACVVAVFSAVPNASAADKVSRIATGDVIANRTVTLATRIVGRITEVHAQEGDAVRSGHVIVEIDDTEYRAKLRSAEAALERAAAEVAHRQRVRDRLVRLAAKNATSEDASDEAEYALQVAEANVKAARAEIDGIRSTLAETRIKVPFDAVVIDKFAEVGMVTQPGEPLYRIQDQSRLRFRARVKERDLAAIRPNDSAQVLVSALDEQPLDATVLRVIPAGDERHTFIVELELPVRPGLYPGMFGKAMFPE